MNNQPPLLQTMDLAVGYTAGSKRTATIASRLALEIPAGRLICLLGPNGSGKSTLLRTLSGLQPALAGRISIMGTDAAKLKPAQLARKISLVLTDPVRHSNLTVEALVSLGRYPHSGWLGVLDEEDRSIIAWAMQVTGIDSFYDRKVSTLSDGENQKVMLARALAQDTPLLMLDEPTAHLDLPSRIQLMRMLHQLARDTHKGILLSTHELDLALQVADEVWLMQMADPRLQAAQAGTSLQKGAPEDLVLNGTFEATFEKDGIVFDKMTGNFRMHEGGKGGVRLFGEGAVAFWTRRALLRRGFTVSMEGAAGTDATARPEMSERAKSGAAATVRPGVAAGPADHTVRIREDNGRTSWILEHTEVTQEHTSIASLLDALDTNKNQHT